METLKVNGAEKQFPEGGLPSTISELLTQLAVDAATVVAELDGQIIERNEFAQTQLRDGCNIELVRFVPGG